MARKRFQIDGRVLQRRDEQERAALVGEEKILGACAGHRGERGLCLLDGEERRVSAGFVHDAERIEKAEEIGLARARGRHGHHNS